jgi:hypothetical protein
MSRYINPSPLSPPSFLYSTRLGHPRPTLLQYIGYLHQRRRLSFLCYTKHQNAPGTCYESLPLAPFSKYINFFFLTLHTWIGHPRLSLKLLESICTNNNGSVPSVATQDASTLKGLQHDKCVKRLEAPTGHILSYQTKCSGYVNGHSC